MTPLVYAHRPARNRLTLAECIAALRCDLGGLVETIAIFALIGALYGVL